jgi:hypothetical protein
MGFPAAALQSVPFPLFWALSDPTKVHNNFDHILQQRVFTVMLSSDQGELVLGGHDPNSVKGPLVTAPVRPTIVGPNAEAFMHYMIDVQSLKLGDKELLNFKKKDIGIQAILDSGTSCLVIPDDDFDGGLEGSPFSIFEKEFPDMDNPSLFVKIAGATFELPADDFVVNGRTCVMKMANTPRTFLLGDVFFRRMVVVHNLTDVHHPTVSLGQRDLAYPLADKVSTLLQTGSGPSTLLESSPVVHRVPLGTKPGKLRSGDVAISTVNTKAATAAGRRLLSVSSDRQRIPLSSSNSYIYYAQLAVGTPRQKNIHVILDTGSSVFAIFAVPHGGPSALVIFLLVAAAVLALAAIGLLVLSWWQGKDEEAEYTAVAGKQPGYGATEDSSHVL